MIVVTGPIHSVPIQLDSVTIRRKPATPTNIHRQKVLTLTFNPNPNTVLYRDKLDNHGIDV